LSITLLYYFPNFYMDVIGKQIFKKNNKVFEDHNFNFNYILLDSEFDKKKC